MDGQTHREEEREGRKEKEEGREWKAESERQREEGREECRTLFSVCGVKISNREGK